MIVSYDIFTAAFLGKITEYSFIHLTQENRQVIVDGYMKMACAEFCEVCTAGINSGDDETRTFDLHYADRDVTASEVDEIVDIVTEGMLVQWFKPYYYKVENLENTLNTSDFTSYSPAELLYRMTTAYKNCKSDFTKKMREYSYRHGDLSDLHT